MGGLSDPLLVDLAASLWAASVSAPEHTPPDRRCPYVIGIAGSVSVGKSTLAATLADLLGERVEVVSTDAFLLSNAQLEPFGGVMRKGYPESWDWVALDGFLSTVRSGAQQVSTPVYSHEEYDIVSGASRTFDVPDVVIVEGLNLLQLAPTFNGSVPLDVARHLDRSIYLDAEPDVIEEWYVQRFRSVARPADGEPSPFYRQFAALSDEELEWTARWVWTEVNEPNLRLHIAPTRERADVVLHKAPDHQVDAVRVRR